MAVGGVAMRLAVFVALLALLLLPQAAAAESFAAWLQQLKTEAIASGIAPHTVHSALDAALLDKRVLALDQKQPESTVSFDAYSRRILDPVRIDRGRELILGNRQLLAEISARYGVPAPMIVALWGIESNFGRNTGGFGIVDSLVTLAYEGRRAAFFRKELLATLKILDDEQVPAAQLRGSWAGAMGQCQFMPSTYNRYAVDYDGDGHRDIWRNEADVLASIANYLAAEGWRDADGWGREVSLSRPVPVEVVGLEFRQGLPDWEALGITDKDGAALPQNPALQASLIQPDGTDGRSFLVYDNFRALMRWNRSTYFATTAGLLADQLD